MKTTKKDVIWEVWEINRLFMLNDIPMCVWVQYEYEFKKCYDIVFAQKWVNERVRRIWCASIREMLKYLLWYKEWLKLLVKNK